MSEEQIKSVYVPESKITKDSITIYGAGKFYEESLILNKVRASFLMIELWKFLNQNKTN